jgi:hypothetical protein
MLRWRRAAASAGRAVKPQNSQKTAHSKILPDKKFEFVPLMTSFLFAFISERNGKENRSNSTHLSWSPMSIGGVGMEPIEAVGPSYFRMLG